MWVESYIETIKRIEMKKVYLAGKVTKNDWRHSIVSGLRSKMWDNAPEDVGFPSCHPFSRKNLQKIKPSVLMDDGENVYVGPLLIADDHGCYHGTTQHGGISLLYKDSTEQRKGLFEANVEALERSDILVAYLDSFESFGTFAEIGHAFGKRIPIHIIYNEEFHNQLKTKTSDVNTKVTEFWYLEQMAKSVQILKDGSLPDMIYNLLLRK
jgi:hypothetical protein